MGKPNKAAKVIMMTLASVEIATTPDVSMTTQAGAAKSGPVCAKVGFR